MNLHTSCMQVRNQSFPTSHCPNKLSLRDKITLYATTTPFQLIDNNNSDRNSRNKYNLGNEFNL